MIVIVGALFASCTSTYQPIGKVSVLSNQPIKSGVVYRQLTTNSGISKKEIKGSEAKDVDDAVKQLMFSVSGGSFVTDVTIYVTKHGYYAVSGNVWGATGDTIPHTYPTAILSNAGKTHYDYSQNGLKSK